MIIEYMTLKNVTKDQALKTNNEHDKKISD